MKQVENETDTDPIPRQVSWFGASAIAFGIGILDFVKEIVLGRTVTRAAYESSVFLVGGLVLGLMSLVAYRRASQRTRNGHP